MDIRDNHQRVKLDREYAAVLHRQGASDSEIAVKTGVKVDTVRSWRKLAGLEANPEKKKRRTVPKLVRDAIEARKHGVTYGVWKAQSYMSILTRDNGGPKHEQNQLRSPQKGLSSRT